MFSVDTTKIKIQLFFPWCSSSIMLLKVRRKEWLYYFNVVFFLLLSACVDMVLRNVLSVLLKFIFLLVGLMLQSMLLLMYERLVLENSCFRLEVLAVTWKKWQDKKRSEMWCGGMDRQVLSTLTFLHLAPVKTWNYIQNCQLGPAKIVLDL